MVDIQAIGNLVKSGWKHVMQQPCDFEVHLNSGGTVGCGVVVIDKKSTVKTFRPEVCNLMGSVTVRAKRNYVVEYESASISYIGEVISCEGVVPRHERFVRIEQEISNGGVITDTEKFEFNFEEVRSPVDSYKGAKLIVKYALRTKLRRKMAMDVIHEEEVWIRCQKPQLDAALCPSLLMVRTEEAFSLWSRPFGASNYEDERPSIHARQDYDHTELHDDDDGEGRSGSMSPVSRIGALNNDSDDVPPPPLAHPKSQPTPSPPPPKKRPALPPPNYNVTEQPVDITIVLDTRMKLGLFIERNVYHTKDIIKGRLCFEELNDFQLASSKIQIVRKEQYLNRELSNEVLFTSEILDGCPTCHVSIPLSLPLRGITSLTPTCLNIHNKANARYFLRILLYEPGGNLPYTAESEINIWRQPDVKAERL
eukprot:TRINITY_DN8422_c0_g2_i2.p1 TRINITY_DN8422_c0_g2~~TRINITY_DN8422_c0_g2_i2.p1  ORF type:complete len:424 (+),score=53.59 TRINITY_DN8422_c0_g2_i2:51-1322(+)